MNTRSRRSRGFSHRLIALLLCCVCLLVAIPVSAIATGTEETQPVTESSGATTEPTSSAPTAPEGGESRPSEPDKGETEPSEPDKGQTQPSEPDQGQTQPSEPDQGQTEPSGTDTPAELSLYEKLMACTTVDEVGTLLVCDTEEAQAAVDAEIETFTDEQIAAVEAHLTELGYYDSNTLQNYSVTIAAGSNGTVNVDGNNPKDPQITCDTQGITGTYSRGTVTITVADTVSAGTYTVSVKQGKQVKHTINVTVTASGSSSGGSTTIAPGNRLYHLDMRISAKVKVTVYNENGTFETKTVTANLSNPTAKIYNTGSKTWSSNASGTDSTTKLKYWNIGFNRQATSDESTGAYEYMQNSPDRQTTEFYNGDTAVLTYTLTYPLDGQTYSVPVELSYVFVESENQCGKKNNTDSQRGFDYVPGEDALNNAFSTSQLQISKNWNDNNSAKRPESITVKVYQTVNGGTKTEYMTLNLNKSHDKSSYTMASGITADKDMTVTFSDNYGVSIVGLPANSWVSSGGTYNYRSCTYSVEEVQITSEEGPLSPVYGSFVYLDNSQKNSYVVVITNTLAYEKLAVKKVWADSESVNHDSDSITVKLTARYDLDGEKTRVPDDWLKTFIGGNTEVTLSYANSWYQVFGNMPVYYTKDGASYPITGFEIEETEINVTNEEAEYTTTCSGISATKDTSGNYYFTVTNTPKQNEYKLTVKKTLSGNMQNDNDTFSFTVTYGETTDTFYLGKNGTKEFTVPAGATVKVTEVPGSYTYSFVSITEGVSKTDLKDESGITFTMPEKDVDVVINNDNTVTIDTGILLDTLPYILILAVVALGAVAMLRKRRSRDED